jgi:hypothetical protein
VTVPIRRLYGAGPAHLLGFAAVLAVSGFAVWHWFDVGASDAIKVLIWFAGAIIGHDLVLLPLYSLLDRALARAPLLRVHMRVPAILSALMLLAFFPLILRQNRGDYGAASSLSPDGFLGRWLVATGVLFGLSALAYVARVLARRRRD